MLPKGAWKYTKYDLRPIGLPFISLKCDRSKHLVTEADGRRSSFIGRFERQNAPMLPKEAWGNAPSTTSGFRNCPDIA